MSHATMHFEDGPDGTIDFRCDWHAYGPDPLSEAHRTAQMVMGLPSVPMTELLTGTPVTGPSLSVPARQTRVLVLK